MGRYRPHLEGGHSSVSLQRAIEALRACNINTGPRAADCAGAAHQWTGAARAPRRLRGTQCRRHGRACRGWLPQRAPSCAAALITPLVTPTCIYRPDEWASWEAHAQGSCGEGPTAATIAKPRVPSPPPLSPCPELRPRFRNGGLKIYYT